jgi:hypothetical protein
MQQSPLRPKNSTADLEDNPLQHRDSSQSDAVVDFSECTVSQKICETLSNSFTVRQS